MVLHGLGWVVHGRFFNLRLGCFAAPWRGPARLFSSGLVDRGEGIRYSRHLVDRRRVHVMAGHGGAGSCLYTKHKKHRMIGPGWPCGGSGGKGGDVIVRSLGCYHSLAHIKGEVLGNDGLAGRKKRINGSKGSDVVIAVPRGVVVRELLPVFGTPPDLAAGPFEPGVLRPGAIERFSPGEVIADLNCEGDHITVAEGGRGGRGNTMLDPHQATAGDAGQERWLELELKTIADVGLVGMPNAGKSTLLSSVSRATPRIAPYPFTTVAPYIGHVDFVDGSGFTIADVPGLVENAHQGEGLGHDFLRHLERTQVLLYVIDVAHSEDPYQDLLSLQREVAHFSKAMAVKPCGVVANKCDVETPSTLAQVDRLFAAIQHCDGTPDTNIPLFVRALSARFGDGVEGLLRELRKLLRGGGYDMNRYSCDEQELPGLC